MPRRLPALALPCLLLAGCIPVAPPTGQTPTPASEAKATGAKLDGGKIAYRPMSLGDLVAEWRSNPSAADSKWNGKPNGVEFAGKLAAVTVNEANQTVAVVVPEQGGNGQRVLLGVLLDSTKQSLNKFKIGDAVRVKAVSAGVTTPEPYLVAWVFDAPR
jgi:hypothetical protein